MTMRELWNKSWEVNTTGAQVMTHTFAPLLLQSADARLIFVTSGTATLAGTDDTNMPSNVPAPKGWPKPIEPLGVSAYRSAKTGMNMMMRSVHFSHAPPGECRVCSAWKWLLVKQALTRWTCHADCALFPRAENGTGSSKEMGSRFCAHRLGFSLQTLAEVLNNLRRWVPAIQLSGEPLSRASLKVNETLMSARFFRGTVQVYKRGRREQALFG